MPLLVNAQMTVGAAPGTGAVTLGAATVGAQAWAAAGAADGEVYSYRIEEGGAWEIGRGVYAASGTRLTRATILASSNGNAAVAFGAGAVVSQVALDLDIAAPGIGDFVLTFGTLPPPGTLKANGAVLPRGGAYAALWAFAQGYGRLVTDSAWQAGDTFAFSHGDGSSTFRLPDARGEFLRMFDDARGLDAGRAIGTVQGQAIPNHYHRTSVGFQSGVGFYGWIDSNNQPIFGFDVIGDAGFAFADNRFVGGTYNVARTEATVNGQTGENRPRNVAPLACIRYK